MTTDQWVTAVLGVLTALGGLYAATNMRTIARETARRQREDKHEEQVQAKRDALGVAQIAADEANRERLWTQTWATMDELRAEVKALRAEVEGRNAQLDALHADMAQMKVVERTLRAENTALRGQLAEKDRQIAELQQRLAVVERKTEGKP